jgi:uncharacterized phage protein gp47/JayE
LPITARQAIQIKSAGEFLYGWLATYGLMHKAAAAAQGVVNGTGVVTTLLQTADGRQYKVSADV